MLLIAVVSVLPSGVSVSAEVTCSEIGDCSVPLAAAVVTVGASGSTVTSSVLTVWALWPSASLDRDVTRLNSIHFLVSVIVMLVRLQVLTFCEPVVTTTVFVPSLFFFFNDTAPTEIYTLSLHDALPISEVTCSEIGDCSVPLAAAVVTVGASGSTVTSSVLTVWALWPSASLDREGVV